MQMTTGGRIFVCCLGLMGVAFVILGSWFYLFPPPNPMEFTKKVSDIVMVVGGSAMTTSAIMILLLARKK